MLIEDVEYQVGTGGGPWTGVRWPEQAGCAAGEVTLWAVSAGAPDGRLVVSRRLPGLNALLAERDSGPRWLMPSDVRPVDDPWGACLDRILATCPPARPAQLLMVVRVRMVAGQREAATNWAIDALHHVSALTGVGGVLTRTVAGPPGGLAWRFALDSGADVEAMDHRLAADSTWHEMTASAPGLFVPATTTRRILSRL